MSDPCFPVLDSEVSTEAPSSYLNQVLRFEKGKTKNLELGSDYQSLMSVSCCSPWGKWVANPAVSLGPNCPERREYITSLFLQPCSALCFFIPKTFFTFKLLKNGARKQVMQCGTPNPCTSFCLSLCFPPRKRLCACAWLWTGECLFLFLKGRTWALVHLQQVSLLKQRE